MKKICFLSLMLIAAHGIANAQLSINLNAGSGLWTAPCDKPNVNGEKVITPNFTPTLSVGASLNNTFNSGIMLDAGLSFHYLSANGSYKSACSSDEYIGSNGYRKFEWTDDEGYGYGHNCGDAEGAAQHFLIAIPLRIGYNIGKFTPNVGVEFGYRINTNGVSNNNMFGVTAGLQYSLTERLNLTCNYLCGLTADMKMYSTVTTYDTTHEEGWKMEYRSSQTHMWRTQRIDIGISYRLGKTEE